MGLICNHCGIDSFQRVVEREIPWDCLRGIPCVGLRTTQTESKQTGIGCVGHKEDRIFLNQVMSDKNEKDEKLGKHWVMGEEKDGKNRTIQQRKHAARKNPCHATKTTVTTIMTAVATMTVTMMTMMMQPLSALPSHKRTRNNMNHQQRKEQQIKRIGRSSRNSKVKHKESYRDSYPGSMLNVHSSVAMNHTEQPNVTKNRALCLNLFPSFVVCFHCLFHLSIKGFSCSHLVSSFVFFVFFYYYYSLSSVSLSLPSSS